MYSYAVFVGNTFLALEIHKTESTTGVPALFERIRLQHRNHQLCLTSISPSSSFPLQYPAQNNLESNSTPWEKVTGTREAQ